MHHQLERIKQLYTAFNARRIDAVLVLLADDVVWANAMDGGYVRGHAGIREYWTRQWSVVDPHVEPVAVHRDDDDRIVVEVIQTVRDLAGEPLRDPTGGLHDNTVEHLFTLRDGLVTRFDVRNTWGSAVPH